MNFTADLEQGLLNHALVKNSSHDAVGTTTYGAIPHHHHHDDEQDQHTASCSYSASSSSSLTDHHHHHQEQEDIMDKQRVIHSSENSPLIILLPDQASVDNNASNSGNSSDDSCSHADCSTDVESNGSHKDSSASTASSSYHNYHDYDVTAFATEHTDWTVSEGTIDNLEEQKVKCCSFPSCGRGLRVPGWEAYNKSLDTNPVITKACTSLCGWFIGDFVTQTVITPGPFDVRRSLTLASFGFFFHGPVGHVVYDNLDQIIVGTGPKEIAAKIFVDQVLWCPIFMLCYFTYLGLANGDSPAMILAKMRSDIFVAILGSWKLWPVAHAIQFRYVATKHRIVYINCIEVCFIMFLSFLGNQ